MDRAREAGLRLAALAGVRRSYVDAGGVERWSSDDAVIGALRGMGYAVDVGWGGAERALEYAELARSVRCWPAVRVVECGFEERVEVRLDIGGEDTWEVMEGMRSVGEGRGVIRLEVGCGVYRVRVDRRDGVEHGVVICAPGRGYRGAGDDRAACVIAPAWSLRGGDDFGVGHFGDLARLGEVAGRFGAGVVGTLPVFAGYVSPEDWASGRADPCPYAPVSRLHLNELYIDPEVVRGAFGGSLSGFVDEETRRAKADVAARVDWRVVSRRVHGVLDACVRVGGEDRVYRSWRRGLDGSFERYAEFRAGMPNEWLDGVFERHMMGQWLAELSYARMLDAVRGSGRRVYLDLPIGMHPRGFEAEAWRGWLMRGATIGAPPDAAFPNGQDWSSPAPLPVWSPGVRPRGACFDQIESYRALCASVMSRCDVLRVDHVLGLQRLWVIPDGCASTDGVYVDRPLEALCAVLRLESHRQKCRVVGEDLGTVDPPVRGEMDRSGFARLVVGQLSVNDDRVDVPTGSVAGVGTHDFPAWEAFWSCSDLEARERFGVIDDGGVAWERGVRRAGLEALGGDSLSAYAALSARLADGWGGDGAWMLVVSLADVIGDTALINVPGTVSDEHWSARLSMTLDEIGASDDVRRWVVAGFGGGGGSVD